MWNVSSVPGKVAIVTDVASVAPETQRPRAPGKPRAKPLYRKLRPRPNGPSKERVVENQRVRMFGAMVEGVAARGYEGTSVAQLCRLAGVSKRTFYEQFENKDACLIAASERILRCVSARIEAAQRAEPDWESGVRAAIGALVRGVAEEQRAAGLVLLTLEPSGARAALPGDRARRGLERMVVEGFRDAPCGAALPPVFVKALAGGVERVVRKHVLKARASEVSTLAGELAEWALGFASPMRVSLEAIGPAQLEPRAQLRSPVGARVGSTGARILRGAGEVVAHVGYSRLSAGRIARVAGLREDEVWAMYESMEECFLDALDVVGFEALMSAVKASRGDGGSLAGVCRGIRALMERVHGDAVLRAVMFEELPGAGQAGLERRERVLGAFTDLLAKGVAPVCEPSEVALEASAGAVWSVVHHHVLHDSAHLLPGLAAYLAYAALAPLVGGAEAVEALAPGENCVCV